MRTVIVGRVEDPALKRFLDEGAFFVANDLPICTNFDEPVPLSVSQDPKVECFKWALEQADAAVFLTPEYDPDNTLRSYVLHAMSNGNSIFHLKSLVAVDRETGTTESLEGANRFIAQSLDLSDTMERENTLERKAQQEELYYSLTGIAEYTKI